MDTQRKKGLLDICVLAVLKRGPSYGYMIMGEVSKCIEISGVTYKQEHNGRTRKYYEITEVGDEKIRSFLNEWEEIEKIYAFIQENSKEDAE